MTDHDYDVLSAALERLQTARDEREMKEWRERRVEDHKLLYAAQEAVMLFGAALVAVRRINGPMISKFLQPDCEDNYEEWFDALKRVKWDLEDMRKTLEGEIHALLLKMCRKEFVDGKTEGGAE